MKSGFKYLLIFTIIFSSCYDNEVVITEAEEILDFQEVAGESSIVMANLLADMMKVVSLSPEVEFGSQERVAEVRSGCPTTFLLSDGVYPDTFFVDFGDCDPSAVFDQRFDGAIQFILNGELDDPNVCPLFSIKNSPVHPQFLIGPEGQTLTHGVEITNTVDFCLRSDNGSSLKYDFTLNGGINLNFLERGRVRGTTCYPSNMKGCITLKENNKDDTTKPATLIDNNYCVAVRPTIIECKFTDGRVERFCIATNPEGINYNLRCGCPQSGQLYIDSPATGDCDNIIGSDSFWDYGFVQNPGVGSCENSALDPDNIATRIPCGQSF